MVVALAGCGRVGFGGAPDASVDALEPDAVPTTFCGIPDGQWRLTPPTPITEINALLMAQTTSADRSEFDPVLSEDGLTLYVTSDQTFQFIVWEAVRPSVTAPFASVTRMGADVNAAANYHFGFQPLTSLRRAVITAPYPGGPGANDLWLGNAPAMAS